MPRKIVSEIILALMLTTMLILISGIQPAEASGTIYIRADGSVDPPTAPIFRDGDIYIFTDDIIDSIVVERDNIIINGAGYILQGTQSGIGIDLLNRSNVTVKNTEIKSFTNGIRLGDSNGNYISGNKILNNYDGILFFGSSQTRIFGNNIIQNTIGIHCHSPANVNNSIFGNNIEANSLRGISLYVFYLNSIYENNIVDGNLGIWIQNSSYNNIHKNNIVNNNKGIYSQDSSNNEFYHNNFNNPYQVQLSTGVHDFMWDNGCEGNYWSDYTGTDADGDGIGDTPYTINLDNTDRYPLMNPYWNPSDINHDLIVDMRDIGTAARAFGTQPGDERWNCHADITGPTHLEPDGKVDMRDISLIARNFGETYP